MHIVAYEDDGGGPAIGIRVEDGVLPTGHTDLTALIKAGPRELDRFRDASESPSQLVHPLRLRAPISPTSTLLLAGGGNQTLTAAEPRPDDLRAALIKIRADGVHSRVTKPGAVAEDPGPES